MGTFQSPVSGIRLLVVLCLPLLACKLGKSDEDPDVRPLPDVPSSTPTPPQPAAQAPPKPAEPAVTATASTPPAEDTAKPTSPSPVTKNAGTTGAATKPKETAETKTSGTKDSTADSTTGGTTTGGKINPRTVPVPVNDAAAACFSKCSKALNKCLADVKLGDDVATKCKGAFESCQKSCKQ